MEYMENTFKVRKETKHDTILHKAKEPKGEGLLPGQIRAKHMEKKDPNPNQTISKWRKTLQAWPTHPERPTRQNLAQDDVSRGHPPPGVAHPNTGSPRAQP